MPYKNKEKQKETVKRYYQEHKDQLKKQRKEQRSKPEVKERIRRKAREYDARPEIKERHEAYNKEYRKTNKTPISNQRKKKNRMGRIGMIEEVAKFRNTETKCWVCGENRIWVLTIAHINGSGKEDRNNHGTGYTFYANIMKGKVDKSNLRIECMNCNSCSAWYGKYPNELTEDEFRRC